MRVYDKICGMPIDPDGVGASTRVRGPEGTS
jgi:hypothetical protein